MKPCEACGDAELTHLFTTLGRMEGQPGPARWLCVDPFACTKRIRMALNARIINRRESA